MKFKLSKESFSKKNLKRNLPALVIFIVGLGIALYPIFSQVYYSYQADETVRVFDHDREKLDSEEIQRRVHLAEGYNDSLKPAELNDPFTKDEEEGVAEYARMLEVNEQIGYIKIPKINVELPIYAGTSDKVLEKGIGHLEGTSLPIGGESTHSVLTGHRGLPTAKLFTDLDKLEVGDKFYVQNIQQSLAYEVDQIKVVEPTEFNDLLVTAGGDYMTLLTCTPYMLNTQRLLVRGHRVPNIEEIRDIPVTNSIFSKIGKEYIVVAVIVAVIFLAQYVWKKKGWRIKNEK